MEIQNGEAIELARLLRGHPFRKDTPERIEQTRRFVDRKTNMVSRREGIIIPTQSDGYLTSITTTSPQVGLDEEFRYVCTSQFDTYYSGGQQ